jgi:prepilin-type N-terminal cleavage/methylation domain-containing protein
MHSKKIKNKKNAFSLIELIVVTSILIIIASSGTVYFTGFVDDLAFNKMIIRI